MSVLDKPLRVVGGKASPAGTVFILMHEGFDWLSAHALDFHIKKVERLGPGYGQIDGDIDNPLFHWPVYGMFMKR